MPLLYIILFSPFCFLPLQRPVRWIMCCSRQPQPSWRPWCGSGSCWRRPASSHFGHSSSPTSYRDPSKKEWMILKPVWVLRGYSLCMTFTDLRRWVAGFTRTSVNLIPCYISLKHRDLQKSNSGVLHFHPQTFSTLTNIWWSFWWAKYKNLLNIKTVNLCGITASMYK